MPFLSSTISSGTLFGGEQQMYPSALIGHREGVSTFTDERTHSFGLVIKGSVEIQAGRRGSFRLGEGMYFSIPGAFLLGGAGEAVLFQRFGYRGLFFVGGPAEESGRLCYIDNCRTTLLCPPPRNGDPCLSLLAFPPSLKQTAHIHPTVRLGAVLSGSGHCVWGNGTRTPLEPGLVFQIEEGLVHCFESGPAGLRIVAYHPDSEGGPTDQNHPMLNRTYLK